MGDKDAIAEATLEAYRQANDDLRHYSGLRFTVLGAFVAISGGLYVLAPHKLHGRPSFGALTAYASMVALACAALEWRINRIAGYYADKIDALAAELKVSPTAWGSPSKSWFEEWLAPLVMLVVYGGSTVMWVYAWLS